MIKASPNNDVLEKCTKDILSLIKPAEDDRNKRQSAIQELEISIQSVASLSGAAVKPFGSFLSNLYSKSGDLDLSVQLMSSSNLPISKKKKQTILRELRKALQKRDVAGYMEFIPHARVPVLQYVSNRFGISCDLSVDNYPGRIKSRVFYWISTLDERFGDMVLLIKEWAKAQNINDPKTGTLNSYSLCLLVLFHFQTCEPAILPPLKDIYELNITEDFEDMTLYNEEHLDEVCAANIAKFESQNKEQKNESSLCHLLATFFNKFCDIGALSSDVISTYTGKIEKIEDNPSRRMKKSYSLFVEDPVERPDNAARAVRINGLFLIASAFSETHLKFVSLEHSDRNDLLAMLCTPAVCSKLGGRVIANPYTSTLQRTHQHARPMGHVRAKVSDNQRQHRQGAKGVKGSRPVHNPTQSYTDTTGSQTPGQARGTTGSRPVHNPTQAYTDTTGSQTPGQARGTTGSRPVHNPTQAYTDTTGSQTPGQARGVTGSRPVHNPTQVYTDTSQTPGQARGVTGSRPVHNPTHVYSDTTGRQTLGQYRSQDPQIYTNTTGHHYQAPRQPELYQNYYDPLAYTPGHQTGAYWNQGHPRGHTTRVQSGAPYQNHNYQPAYSTVQHAAESYPYQSAAHTNRAPVPYQYHSQPQVFTNGTQTPGPHPYQSQPQAHPTTADYVPRPYQNGHYDQQMYAPGTGVYYQSPRERQYTPDRHSNRSYRNNKNGVATYVPVAGGLQNGPARPQASSSRTE